ncbi:MAG: hypothetical protein JXP48_00905 [Acidobacteria bacterium]|nr:hypothetical protein [Acidobacteriota bacterium]
MNKVYYVTIKGRTLESRNLKHLLARAVATKRTMDRSAPIESSCPGRPAPGAGPDLYSRSCQAVGA